MLVCRVVSLEAIYTLWNEGGLGELCYRLAEQRPGTQCGAARLRSNAMLLSPTNHLHGRSLERLLG